MHFQKYIHVIIICMSKIYAYLIHFCTCIVHNTYKSEIYSCLKYMHVRNMCMLEIYAWHKYMGIRNTYACQKYIHVRNIACQKYIEENLILSEESLQVCLGY